MNRAKDVAMGMKDLIKNMLFTRKCSSVEQEIRRRLTWRMALLSVAPVPCLMLLMYFLYCFIRLNTQTIDILLKQNADMAVRIGRLEHIIKEMENAALKDAKKLDVPFSRTMSESDGDCCVKTAIDEKVMHKR